MASVNKVILVGNLGRDPELRSFPNGDQVANVSIATSERWNDKASGEPREHTEWHNLTFTQRLAEIAGQYLRKGSSIYVEGSLRTRKWQDRDGQDRYTTEVRVTHMQMLGGRPDAQGNQGQQQAPRQQAQAPRQQAPAPRQRPQSQAPRQQQAPQGGGFDDMDDDIPW